jgi:hypothetical protein
MKNILAIARLTFWEGIRMRIVLVFLVVLVVIVLLLPVTVKGDETLTGRLQTFLSYSLGAVSLLLGLSCVFLSCATLTGDIRNCTIHLVLTKPVSRFQVLVGKWLGINVLMVLLLAASGLTIYGFARSIRTRPAAFHRDEVTVRDVVWNSRVARTPTPPPGLAEDARKWVESQMKQGQDFARGPAFAVAERLKELQNDWRTLPPGMARFYLFKNLVAPRDPNTAVQIRYRARGENLQLDEMVPIAFTFADPDTGQPLGQWQQFRMRSAELHQFLAKGQMVIKNGRAALAVLNPLPPDAHLIIHLEDKDGLQILYSVGTFEENYLKTLVMIAARLAFLSAIGLFFGAFVSFPVACLCTFTFYVICLGMPFWLESVGANIQYWTANIDPYGRFGPWLRPILVPLMKFVFPNFSTYNGAAHLIDGEYISGGLMAMAIAHTLIFGGLLLALPGWLIFRSREIAEVTV